MYLLGSVPPNVSSPFASPGFATGANEIPTSRAPIKPCSNALSVTVGTHWEVWGSSVPVNPVGMNPALEAVRMRTYIVAYRKSGQWGQCCIVRHQQQPRMSVLVRPHLTRQSRQLLSH